MALPRVTFFFANGSNGWTETFYSNAGTLADAMSAAKTLYPLRTNVQAKGVQLQYIRVSDDLVAGDSVLYTVPTGSRENKDLVNFGEANAPYDGLLIRLTSTELNRRMYIMRGIPDEVQVNNNYVPSIPFGVSLGLYMQLLTQGRWGIKLVDKTTVLEKPIVSLTQNYTTGRVTVTVASTATWANGDLVNIYGRMGCKGFRGLYRIMNVTATTFDVLTRRDVSGYNGNGKVRKQTYSIVPFAPGYSPMRLARRATGRPSFQERGRRSALPRV